MPTYAETWRLAEAFSKAYPKSLSKRLEWWSQALGIDRVRFLRLLGMSLEEAAQAKQTPWRTILREWEDQGRWLEGLFRQAVALFHYDWQAFAEWLHHPPLPANGDHRESPLLPPGRFAALSPDEELKFRRLQLAEGGPQTLSTFLAYLGAALRTPPAP